MMNYKGYYIDHVTFNSKEEIENFLKEQAIKSYKQAIRFFNRDGSFEASIYAYEKAEYLNKQFGMTWSEIEEIEIEVLKAA